MQAEILEGTVETVDTNQAWLAHRLEAVRKFLKSAVVIDNEPLLRETVEAAANEGAIKPLEDSDDGMGGAHLSVVLKSPTSVPELSEVSVGVDDHPLDVRAISDAFVDAGIACAFVLPDNKVSDDDSKVNRALAAAKISDIVVIDWYLKPKSASLTLKVLELLAKSDVDESGRMRLICVYTGQTITDDIFSDMKRALIAGGVSLSDMGGKKFYAKNGHCLIMALNKAEVSSMQLPSTLVEAFTHLADGLIPAFSLAAVGAIRKNIHHMVTRFDRNLDSSYIANRLITNPPGDVAELMRELLVAECDNAIGLEAVADEFLDIPAIEKWLDFNKDSLCVTEYETKKQGANVKVKIDFETLLGVLRNGVNDKEMIVGDKDVRDFPEYRRNKVTEALAGSVAKAMSAENDFSRLVAFRREAFGSTKLSANDGWLPSLTTGTVLKIGGDKDARFFMCLTPACDMLRLKEPRNFVFLEGVAQPKPYNFVVKDSGGEAISLFFDKKSPSISTFVFAPDESTQRVRASKAEDKQSFKFCETGGVEFLWLGEIRYGRAASEMSSLASNWMRIGILDSEYLRISAKGHFKFGV
ncbi:UNVERIFIED_ORG: hypothetical protein J2Y76_000690 [Pseudomonas reinekei]|uniref:response regulator receiver domain n=1 Tax=Pseudomonas laurylsulfatiphila TaxID=2011015 RepID=UPI003D1B866F|nr:hypothetical protein [Pseudomonas reinekei]